MAIKYSNNAKTTLAAAINSTVTTITVADASTLPTLGVGDEMYLTLSEPFGPATEIIKCTSISDTTLTVVRGHENTTPISWVVDSNIQLRITAGLLSTLLDGKFSVNGGTVSGPVTATDFIGPLNGPVQFTAKNTSGSTLTKGQVVYISGVSGNNPTVALANADDPAKMPAYGLVAADALDTAEVEIITFGTLTATKTDYTGWALGDTLYVSTVPGELTNAAPSGESSLIQNLGRIRRLHQSAGSITVGGAGRTNATPNLNNGNVFIGDASNQSVARALVIADTTGLQSELDGKVDDSQVLTNVPSGAVFTDTNTVYTHPTTHPASMLTGALPAIDGSALTGVTPTKATVDALGINATHVSGFTVGKSVPANAVFTDTDTNTTYSVGDGGLTQKNFTSAKSLKLDGIATSANNYSLPASVVHDTESGALHSTDALRISGHTISLYKGDGTSESVVVPDNNTDTNTWRPIDDTPVNGVTTESISSNWAFDHAASSSAHPRDTRNQIAGTYNNYSFPYTISSSAGNNTVVLRHPSGYINGNYFNGTGTFATSGAASGMGIFTGTNGSDTYGRSYTAAAARTLLNVENGATADQTASQLLTKIKTVDGSGSGLDADLLDGYNYATFAAEVLRFSTGGSNSSGRLKIRLPWNTNAAKMVKFTISQYSNYQSYDYIVSAYLYPSINQWHATKVVYSGTGTPNIVVGRDADGRAYVSIADSSYTGLSVHSLTVGYTGTLADTYNQGWSVSQDSTVPTAVSPTITKTWTSTNDGSGSGLDADLLDGQQGSYYYPASNPSGYISSYTDTNTWRGLGTTSTTAAAGNHTHNYAASSHTHAYLGSTAKAADSNLLDGLDLHTGRNDNANKVVRTNSSGYADFGWINTTSGVASGTPTRIYCSQDSYLRYYTPSSLAPFILNQGSTKNAHTHNYAAASHTHSYLPLSGGAMTGNISFPAGQNITRTTHSSGFLEGSYNSVGANSTKSNPIYTIGTSYNPTDTALSNMYGIGFASSGFTSILDGWGLYVADNGNARIGLSGTTGRIRTVGTIYADGLINSAASVRAPIFYDSNNTAYYTNPASTSVMSWVQLNGGIAAGSWEIMKESNDDYVHYFQGNTRLTLTSSGNLTASGSLTAYSDERLKTNIETIPSALEKVNALRGVTFDMNGVRGLGVIAQETEAVIPEVVMTADDEMGTKSVAYGNIVGLLIEAIKEQQVQIDELKELIK